jgi:outer membrane protein OmpA-like peptidoglycan-associated protein
MLSIYPRFIMAICIAILLTACSAKKNLVVLLPDSDGKTGKIEVLNQGGSQIINEANKAVTIRSSQTAPEPPVKLQEEQVKQLFGEALDAMPHVSAHYILYFQKDSKYLTDESSRIMNDILDSVRKIKPIEISVVGHTDRVGTRERNFRLGLDRAAWVKHLLSARGVDEGIIEITSHGEDDPLIATDDEVPEPRNRRVEIVIR